MVVKVYLAAAYSRAAEMRHVRNKLEAVGFQVVSRWIDVELFEGKEDKICASSDCRDLRSADYLLFFSDGPQATGKGGRHVEFGIAWALGVPVLVIGPKENIFHSLPGVMHTDSLDQAIERLSHLTDLSNTVRQLGLRG